MATKYALTRIKYGKEDGKSVVVLPGEEVKGLPKELVQTLEKRGEVATKGKARVIRPELFPVEDEEEESSTAASSEAESGGGGQAGSSEQGGSQS